MLSRLFARGSLLELSVWAELRESDLHTEKTHTAMAENAGLENHRIKSFKNKGRDVEVSQGPCCR